MKAKERHKHNILEYLGNPENGFPDRLHIAKDVLKFKSPAYLYRIFTLEELAEIEKEGLELRRKKYISHLAMVDTGLLKRAATGDPAAAKLVYQRFEAWSEKIDLKHKANIGLQLTDEERALAIKAVDYVVQSVLRGENGNDHNPRY